MLPDRIARIRKIIDEAKPAEEYFAEQAKLEAAQDASGENDPAAKLQAICVDLTSLKQRPTKASEQAEMARLQKLDDCLDFYLRGTAPIRDGLLNRNELRSVVAVIAYVAHREEVSTETVHSIVKTAFGVDDIRSIDQNNYDDVIRYLVDLNVKNLLN